MSNGVPSLGEPVGGRIGKDPRERRWRAGAESDIATAIRVGKGFGHFHHTAYSIAAVYSVLGKLDQAEEWIENAANEGFPCYPLFENDPNLERVRTLPRFVSFVAKLRQQYEYIPGETE